MGHTHRTCRAATIHQATLPYWPLVPVDFRLVSSLNSVRWDYGSVARIIFIYGLSRGNTARPTLLLGCDSCGWFKHYHPDIYSPSERGHSVLHFARVTLLQVWALPTTLSSLANCGTLFGTTLWLRWFHLLRSADTYQLEPTLSVHGTFSPLDALF